MNRASSTSSIALFCIAACTVPNPDYRPPCEAKHSECASNACQPDGRCAVADEVAYIDPSGTNGTSCTQEMPCTSFQAALNTKRPYIKMTGTTDAHVSIVDQDVTVLADAGAKLTSKTVGNLVVVGGRSHVSIFDLVITGSTGPDDPGGTGVVLPKGNSATLSLERVTISNSEGSGLVAYGGVVNATKCTISGNAIGGLATDGGELNVTQSTIRSNGEGGLYAKNPTAFQITNNFIYGNGASISKFGGIYLEAKPNSAVANKIEFNTIVDNHANTGTTDVAGGVVCNVAGLAAANNLIFRNTGGPSSDPQVAGTCTYKNSLLTAPPNPGFASATDYHLTAQTPSTIIDKADCGGTKVDIDGESRPRGGGCDLGADEAR